MACKCTDTSSCKQCAWWAGPPYNDDVTEKDLTPPAWMPYVLTSLALILMYVLWTGRVS